MRAAAVQLNSTEDKERNLATADRLVRDAAADGADLIVLPEKFNVLGEHERLRRAAPRRSTARRSRGRATPRASSASTSWPARSSSGARAARSSATPPSTSGPTARSRASTARSTCSTWSSAGSSTASPRPRSRATRSCCPRPRDGVPLGLTVCYDLRFPELFRILAIRGARVITLPAAFTKVTGQAHWEILIRARAIENQAFVVAADQIGDASAGQGELRRLDDRRPVGRGARARPRRGVLHRREPRLRPPGRGARPAAEPRQPRGRRLPLARTR